MFLDPQNLQKQIKHFLKAYECSYNLSLLPLKLCKSGGGGIKESDTIKHFLKIVGNSLVIMHPNMMHSRPQLLITGCFGYSEVHLFQFQRARRG